MYQVQYTNNNEPAGACPSDMLYADNESDLTTIVRQLPRSLPLSGARTSGQPCIVAGSPPRAVYSPSNAIAAQSGVGCLQKRSRFGDAFLGERIELNDVQ